MNDLETYLNKHSIFEDNEQITFNAIESLITIVERQEKEIKDLKDLAVASDSVENKLSKTCSL